MPQPASPLALVAVPASTCLSRREGGRVEGPGWFDSSFELRRGLDVSERWSDDDRVRSWVEDFLTARHVAASGAGSAMA